MRIFMRIFARSILAENLGSRTSKLSAQFDISSSRATTEFTGIQNTRGTNRFTYRFISIFLNIEILYSYYQALRKRNSGWGMTIFS